MECSCPEAARNRAARRPQPATSTTADGELVCRFCWEVINRCAQCGTLTEDDGCDNPFCERWRFGAAFDELAPPQGS